MTPVGQERGAINLQLYRRLVALIVAGHWSDGSKLPSSRKLASDVGVSRTTASLALDRLVADGWAVARPRIGIFVAHRAGKTPSVGVAARSAAGTPPIPFELAQGAVDCFPHARWSRLQSKVWSSSVPDALYEPEIAGDYGLRSSIVRLLTITRGIECAPEDVFVVPSTRVALVLAASVIERDVAGALVEDPGYRRGADALAAGGLATSPVAVDRKGVVVDGLPTGAGRQLAYVTPAAQFPTGAILCEERRAALTGWCLEGQHWLFEDDYDWDARFDGERPPSALSAVGAIAERTFYCQSFSRALFSSFRMTALVVPTSLRHRANAVQDRLEGSVNLPNQLVLREFINSGAYAGHLRHLRTIYRERRAAMLDLFEPYFGQLFENPENTAGLRAILRCPSERAKALAGRLRAEGIMCSTLSDLSVNGVEDDGLVLGFASFPAAEISAYRERVRNALER